MTDVLRFALIQQNPTVGDVAGNLKLAKKSYATAKKAGADIVLLPELFMTGYFPEDVLFKPQFIIDVMAAAIELAQVTADEGPSLIISCPWIEDDLLYNAVLLAEDGEIKDRRYKHNLPNDDVFYEKRYFESGPFSGPMNIRGVRIGIPICEDIWHPEVCECLAETGAEILLCPNGSPYQSDKHDLRMNVAVQRVTETGLPLIYLNQVGGQDELVYDGASFGLNADRSLAFQAKSFQPEIILSDWARKDDIWVCDHGRIEPLANAEEAPWQACVLGLRDYVHKNHFKKVVLGLSGGIDSAIVAAMAVDAFGPENVHCIMLPYTYTSKSSLTDAEKCAKNLGVRYDIVPIETPVVALNKGLKEIFGRRKADTTEENIQSRMRGVVLMAVSNKLGSMLLTTGNKSEMAVGYATIYGDMNGGFNPIKDMYKMQVYALAKWRNTHRPEGCLGPDGVVIPKRILTKAPSAELAPNQTDQDSLPPYPVLDAILEGLIEDEASVDEIVARGHKIELVKRIQHLVYIAEYKRRQSAPGVKISSKAFGIGRKYPITNGYRDEGTQE